MIFGDFHIHSWYSYDSISNPRAIMRCAKEKGFTCISITDHNSIKGSLEAKKHESEFGIKVIIGEEIRTDIGDIIGLGLVENITTGDWLDVIKNINQQGGISVLAHPFRGHKNILEVAQEVDLIEVWNSHSSYDENSRSHELAIKLNKPYIVGSDAHTYREIGSTWFQCASLSDFDKVVHTKLTSTGDKIISNLIGHLRRGRIWNIPITIVRTIINDKIMRKRT